MICLVVNNDNLILLHWLLLCVGGQLGHYIPQLAQLIVNRNKGTKTPIINLKGILVSI